MTAICRSLGTFVSFPKVLCFIDAAACLCSLSSLQELTDRCDDATVFGEEIGKTDMSAVVCRGNNIAFRPLSEAMGAEVFGADRTASLDDGVKLRLRGSLADYRHLLVRDGQISAANQVNFAKVFVDISIR